MITSIFSIKDDTQGIVIASTCPAMKRINKPDVEEIKRGRNSLVTPL